MNSQYLNLLKSRLDKSDFEKLSKISIPKYISSLLNQQHSVTQKRSLSVAIHQMRPLYEDLVGMKI